MQTPNSILMRGFVAAFVLATTVAASAAISSRETAAGSADNGFPAAVGEAPVAAHTGFMAIAIETMQIAGQLSGYAEPPKHTIISDKITGNNAGLPIDIKQRY